MGCRKCDCTTMCTKGHFSTVSISRYMKLIANDCFFFSQIRSHNYSVGLVLRLLGVWREESVVYTVRACANSGGIPLAPITIPYTIMHQLGNELFIQIGIKASPSATFDKAVSYTPRRLFCPDLCLGPAYGTVRGQRVPVCNVAL